MVKKDSKYTTPKDAYKLTTKGMRDEIKQYGHTTQGTYEGILRLADEIKSIRENNPKEYADPFKGSTLRAGEAAVMAYANERLKDAQRTGDVLGAGYIASLYEKIGQGNRRSVLRRLKKTIDLAEKKKWVVGHNDIGEDEIEGSLPKRWSEEYRSVEAERIKEGAKSYREGCIRGLEKFIEKNEGHIRPSHLETTAVTTSILGLVGGAFFLSANMTGNVIGLSSSSSNIIGSVLLVIGLVACFSWVKSKKKVVKKRK